MNRSIQLIALLGNPGKEYAHTRHNAGRLLSEREPFASAGWSTKFNGSIGEIRYNGSTTRVFNPETFMNDSGTSVRKALDFFKLEPEEILVAHDELELPFGTSEFRFGGGLGGHNGLRSLKQCLGSGNFWRLRIGIGRPGHKNIASYVLSRFSREEKDWLENIYSEIITILPDFILKPEQKKTVHFH